MPSKSSVKEINSFFILLKIIPEIIISIKIAATVTIKNKIRILVVIAAIEVFNLIVIIKPE